MPDNIYLDDITDDDNRDYVADYFKSPTKKKGKEASNIQKLLGNFDYNNSRAWKEIKILFSSGIRHTELISIATVLISIYNLPKVSRPHRRSFPLLVKWFDDNWEKIQPIISKISLLDKERVPINSQREMCDNKK
ncbi:hypothetical protein TRFO_20568 [Tritrichomonas foetus]|uniref:Uncharacterized protein n=1 Tax=Tritrichomonas foetus TaxID=1144522 RepID=A0A1J4KG48_9EUKA|nr:hypothetical protein TRFO_20568 [Tritrichomonas foetus]|eukprot:OHT10195.1 hypothetical protein TRFO_20568 [Tritrichomonas foetus]